MPKYIVKFLKSKYLPDFNNLAKYQLKLGSFFYYREIEDSKLRDPAEGQRGLDLILRKPSKGLDELIEQNGYGHYTPESLDTNGYFKPEYHLLVHEHMNEYNTWIFCCSIIDNLNEIEEIKENFGCDKHYFISDINAFINSIQKSLAKDLKSNPYTSSGGLRIIHEQKEPIFLDGWKNPVTYKNDSKYMKFTYETLEDFLNHKDSRAIDQSLWFIKPTKFYTEKEFRFILYPSEKRPGTKRFSINEKSCLLDVDLTECISLEPTEILFPQ